MTKVLSMDFSRILAYVLAVLAVVGLILFGAHVQMFINIAALLIVAVPALGLMYFRFGFEAFLLGRLQEDRRLFFINQWERAFWHALGIATITSIIQILANFSDPKNLGPPLAVMLLSFLYILIIRFFILEPLREFKPVSSNASAIEPSPKRKLALMAKTVVATIVLQVILIIGAISFDEYILYPQRSAEWEKEREIKNKKWEKIKEKLNQDLGLKLSRDDVGLLHMYVTEKEYYNYGLLNRIYNDKDLDREKLFKYLEKLEVEE